MAGVDAPYESISLFLHVLSCDSDQQAAVGMFWKFCWTFFSIAFAVTYDLTSSSDLLSSKPCPSLLNFEKAEIVKIGVLCILMQYENFKLLRLFNIFSHSDEILKVFSGLQDDFIFQINNLFAFWNLHFYVSDKKWGETISCNYVLESLAKRFVKFESFLVSARKAGNFLERFFYQKCRLHKWTCHARSFELAYILSP